MQPLVTVICLCYNHAPFVEAALEAVALQTYGAIQLIIVDDCSTDNSVAVIEQWLSRNTSLQAVVWLPLATNHGNCKAFNYALQYAQGDYVIDLAADDLLLPERITQQVTFFEQQPPRVGVIYANAAFIDEKNQLLGNYANPNTLLPSGDIYEAIVATTFICTPTMMIRKTVLDTLGGYDTRLSYEDYDFWVRSARSFHYAYQPLIHTHKRVVQDSWGAKFYNTQHNPHLASTLLIFEKIRQMNRNEAENKALAQRIHYHLRLCCYTHHFQLVAAHLVLLAQLGHTTWAAVCWGWLARLRVPLHPLYKCYFLYQHRWAK